MSHCLPETAEGAATVTAYGILAHRHADHRSCGATTIVVGQSTVFVNGRLWSVLGDPNNHGAGNLINTGSGVYCEGIPVIVHAPDPAVPDNLCAPAPGDGGDGGP